MPPVTADLDRMIQVMLNLLSNAVKFCDAGQRPGRDRAGRGATAACASTCATTARASAARTRQVIFDKFRQAGDTLTDKPQGSGLGLHISRQIVEHFGGRMWVESRPGEGACFSFTLPLAPAAARDVTPSGRMTVTKKVLIADDEPNIVTALEFLLQQQRLRGAASARNGDEALQLVESFGPTWCCST